MGPQVIYVGGGARPPHDGQGKTPGRAKREREVYGRTQNRSIEGRAGDRAGVMAALAAFLAWDVSAI
jgi:hypothetical protein